MGFCPSGFVCLQRRCLHLKQSSWALFLQNGKWLPLLSNLFQLSLLEQEEKVWRWLYYSLNSKWVSIKFGLWTTTSKLVNIDIYFLDVGKGNKTEISKFKIPIWLSRKTDTVSRRFIQHLSKCWISFEDASFFLELNIIEMHRNLLLWITYERCHLLPIDCRRRQTFFFLDTCLLWRVDGRVTRIQSIQ